MYAVIELKACKCQKITCSMHPIVRRVWGPYSSQEKAEDFANCMRLGSKRIYIVSEMDEP